MDLTAVALIGLGVGFLGGLFGKGGSAVATPLLHAIGVPAMVAVAAPLPATIPSTAAASIPYRRARLIDARVARWSLAFGIPATVAGALLTTWVDGSGLVRATDVVLMVIGLRLALRRPPHKDRERGASDGELATVALLAGVASGLLANSGGFLLAPLYVIVAGLPIKRAFATSLVTATALAVPGTIVHTALGHVDWAIVAVFASTSVPLSFLGARLALRVDAARLERAYGVSLALLGAAFLVPAIGG